MADLVRAAGGVVTRHNGKEIEVLVVHRPSYDDWSFPKGKADRNESDEQTARREVQEESGVDPELHDELETLRYKDRKRRPKQVRYWHMTVHEETPFEPNREVDEIRWLPVRKAAKLLSYEHDRVLLNGRLATALEDAGGPMRANPGGDA